MLQEVDMERVLYTSCAYCDRRIKQKDVVVATFDNQTTTIQEHFCCDECSMRWVKRLLRIEFLKLLPRH